MNLKQVGICLGIGLLAFQANAAEPFVEPGLWEMTMDMDGQHAEQLKQLEKQMQGMSEQERQMMANMMGSAGMSMMKPNVIRTCITPEEASNPPANAEDMDGCEQTIASQTAGQIHLVFRCPDSSGEAFIRIADTKAYDMQITGVSDGNKYQQKIKAKWLKSACN